MYFKYCKFNFLNKSVILVVIRSLSDKFPQLIWTDLSKSITFSKNYIRFLRLYPEYEKVWLYRKYLISISQGSTTFKEKIKEKTFSEVIRYCKIAFLYKKNQSRNPVKLDRTTKR